MKTTKNIPWVCTDTDEDQYGRFLKDFIYEFKDKETDPTIIDLKEYTLWQIEDCINSYGYTLFDAKIGTTNIVDQYGVQAQWIIAECVFESKIKPIK